MIYSAKMFRPYLLEIISNWKRKRVGKYVWCFPNVNQRVMKACSPENKTILFHRTSFFPPSPEVPFSLLPKRRRGRYREKHELEREALIGHLPYLPRPGIVWTWTRDRTPKPGTCPEWESNPPPLQLWDDALTNWPIVAWLQNFLLANSTGLRACLSTHRMPHWSPG